MLNVQKMIASAEECLGWPYVSPGSNNASGIDCSGLFVKIYEDQGASIYHGSNRIYRKYCSETGRINSVSDLQVGMAIFKWKDQKAKGYDDDLGDFVHIGLVVSVNPLKIIHASSDAGCVTTDYKIGKWKFWGKLSAVDYGSSGAIVVRDDPVINQPSTQEEDFIVAIAAVVNGNGKSVKLRNSPSTNEGLYWDIADQTSVVVLKKGDNWSQVRAGGRTGYMMTKFLDFEPEEDFTPADSYVDENGTVVCVFTEEEAQTFVPLLDKLTNQLVKAVGRG